MKIRLGIASALMLTLFGCGSGDDAASCRFDMQQALDKGNYSVVIAELSNPGSSCYAAYSGNDWQLDLGAAYMGQAGLAISDIIALVGAEDEGGNSSFDQFIDGVSSKQTTSALDDLANANNAFTSALNGTSCLSLNLSNSEKDICLYQGLVSTLKATTSMSFLTDNLGILLDDSNPDQDLEKEKMQASMCALQKINQGTDCSAAPGAVTVGTDVDFTYNDSSTRTFRDIQVIINGNEYHRLGTGSAVTPGTTVLTKDYCQNDFSNLSATWNVSTSPYACPLNQDPAQADQNVSTLLVETLNSGLDSLQGALGGDPDLAQDIQDYKTEIDVDSNGITIDEIQNYLNNL